MASQELDHSSGAGQNDKLPNIFYDKSDPELAFFRSVLGSFTDRALFPSRNTYPQLREGLAKGDVVVILSSRERTMEGAHETLLKSAKEATNIETFQAGKVWVHVFEVQAGL